MKRPPTDEESEVISDHILCVFIRLWGKMTDEDLAAFMAIRPDLPDEWR